MLVQRHNINQVKIGGWAYHCCEEDLRMVDQSLLEDIKNDVEDPIVNYFYHDKRIDALTECFATHCRSYRVGGSATLDSDDAIRNLYEMICKELNLKYCGTCECGYMPNEKGICTGCGLPKII